MDGGYIYIQSIGQASLLKVTCDLFVCLLGDSFFFYSFDGQPYTAEGAVPSTERRRGSQLRDAEDKTE